ncbi:iron chelate uptake ABC transporter family permease subunit, partial [Hymenobacter agri]
MKPSSRRVRLYFSILAVALLVALVLSAQLGAVALSFAEIGGYLGGNTSKADPTAELHRAVFFQIRLPRVLLCAVVGAALAMSGTLMQALFRNPIVEPGLIGTSAGAALGAAVIFV